MISLAQCWLFWGDHYLSPVQYLDWDFPSINRDLRMKRLWDTPRPKVTHCCCKRFGTDIAQQWNEKPAGEVALVHCHSKLGSKVP